jgi:cell wall assembly regulator SMI1
MDEEAFDRALADIVEWMTDNKALEIVANLAEPAAPDALARVESSLGKPFPAALRRLYERHDGQRNRDEFPFYERGRLCDLEYGQTMRDRLLDSLWQDGTSGRPSDMDHAMEESSEPLQDKECTSAWWPLVDFEGAFLAVNLDSGRVFEVDEDGPQIRFRADDVSALLASYADDLWNDVYELAGDPSLDGVTAEGMISLKRHVQERDA